MSANWYWVKAQNRRESNFVTSFVVFHLFCVLCIKTSFGAACLSVRKSFTFWVNRIKACIYNTKGEGPQSVAGPTCTRVQLGRPYFLLLLKKKVKLNNDSYIFHTNMEIQCKLVAESAHQLSSELWPMPVRYHQKKPSIPKDFQWILFSEKRQSL